jgi:hypothetical protein
LAGTAEPYDPSSDAGALPHAADTSITHAITIHKKTRFIFNYMAAPFISDIIKMSCPFLPFYYSAFIICSQIEIVTL